MSVAVCAEHSLAKPISITKGTLRSRYRVLLGANPALSDLASWLLDHHTYLALVFQLDCPVDI
jgi:hypothetical protein